MRNFSLLLKLTLIVGIIALLNSTNFDLDYNKSLATENITAESNSAQLNIQSNTYDSTDSSFSSSSSRENASSQSKEIDAPKNTLTKANTNAHTKDNLSSRDIFNEDEYPYFQTETIPASANATTITVQNRWNTTLTIAVQTSTEETITVYYISEPTSSTFFELSPEKDVYLIFWPGSPDGFRDWKSVSNPFVNASGESASQASSFVHIPDMNYFTTDASGTQAGDYFFANFFYNSKATSLPEGSFDISSIKSVISDFFFQFNFYGSLTALPANSFITSNITSAVHSFFIGFNANGSLTSLPANSFNTSSITSVGWNFFSNFNANGSLTALPANSFNTSNIISVGQNFFGQFNAGGKITKNPSSGISIMNTSEEGINFYYANGGNDLIGPGSTFSFYQVDVSFTMSFNTNGGSEIEPITTLQSTPFSKPVNPTKSGYKFIQWTLKDETTYDWNSTASDNLTLYAEWEDVPSPPPSPTPTPNPTTSTTISPSPTKSPTASPTSSTSPTPSPSNSSDLPATGDDSFFIFYGIMTSTLLAIISLVIYYLKRKSRSKTYL